MKDILFYGQDIRPPRIPPDCLDILESSGYLIYLDLVPDMSLSVKKVPDMFTIGLKEVAWQAKGVVTSPLVFCNFV